MNVQNNWFCICWQNWFFSLLKIPFFAQCGRPILKTHTVGRGYSGQVGRIGREFHSLDGCRLNVYSNLGYQGTGKARNSCCNGSFISIPLGWGTLSLSTPHVSSRPVRRYVKNKHDNLKRSAFVPLKSSTTHVFKKEPHIWIPHNKTNNFRELFMGQRHVFWDTL